MPISRLEFVSPAGLGALAPWLTAEDRARAGRFVNEADRLRCLIGKGVARRALSSILGVSADELRFAEGVHGKPELVAPASALRFNLSHAGDWVLFACVEGRRVGVDVEVLDPVHATDAMAETHFAPAELQAWRGLPEAERLRGFYRLWTRKEAFIKATGEGMSADLRSFEVSLDDTPRLLATRPDGAEAARWVYAPIAAPAGYEAAIVVEGGPSPIEARG